VTGRLTRLATALALLIAAAPALAAHDAELSMMDDQALLGTSQAKIDATLTRMKALGADRLRVSAFWADIAPHPHARSAPTGFNPRDPADPRYRWAALDRAVGSAFAHGLRVMISISTPAPYWGTSAPRKRNPVWSPKPAAVAAFAQAVAARYAGVADQFAILNEPNQGAWLQPQSLGRRAVAPHLYRAIARAAYPAIKSVAPKSTVLIGELASSGRDDPGVTRPIRPLVFLRLMGCRNAHFRAIRSGPCRGFRPVRADAIGHHPYALFQSPFSHSFNRDDAAIGDWRRLESRRDPLVRGTALRPSSGRRLPIYYTEFGYQTDPPDPFAGIPLARQDRWLQDAAYVAWATPRVRGIDQFELMDGAIGGGGPLAYRQFQSGLWFANGKPKPSAHSFPNPIVIRGSLVWGQARPGGTHRVVIERRAPGSRKFSAVATVPTDSRGYFHARVARRRGTYRFRWSDAGGRGASEALSVR
jgi:hypothetical protein